MQVTLSDLLNLLDIYNNIPPWLPLPEGGALPINDTHQEYQEAYSIGIQVAISKTHIQKTLSHYQNELGSFVSDNYEVWEGAHPSSCTIPIEGLDCYSQKVLSILQRYQMKTWQP